jgi:hypothetical protein
MTGKNWTTFKKNHYFCVQNRCLKSRELLLIKPKLFFANGGMIENKKWVKFRKTNDRKESFLLAIGYSHGSDALRVSV